MTTSLPPCVQPSKQARNYQQVRETIDPTNNYDLATRKQETGKDLHEQLIKGSAVSSPRVLTKNGHGRIAVVGHCGR
jgi:hypothetical protein